MSVEVEGKCRRVSVRVMCRDKDSTVVAGFEDEQEATSQRIRAVAKNGKRQDNGFSSKYSRKSPTTP